MKQVLLMLIFLTPIKSIAQKTITTYYDVFNKHKKETITLNASGQYHGKYTSYFEDGTVREQRTYVNGKYHGEDKAYHIGLSSRGLAYIHNYKNDTKDGLQKNYCAYGGDCYSYVREEEFYKDGYVIWRKYYDEINGKRVLQKEQYFDANDTYNPYLEKRYDEKGKQVYQVARDGKNFQEGMSGGLYDMSGAINAVSGDVVYANAWELSRIEFTTVNGKMDGLYREWCRNGQLADSSYWKNGVRDGMEYQYYDDGTLKSARNYIEGVEIVKINDTTTVSGYHYIGGIKIATIDSTKTITDNSGHYQMFNRDGKLIMTGDNTSIVIYDGEGKIIGRSKP